MRFLNREGELMRLGALSARREGGLAVVYGRRRVGKTRLLLEWVRAHGGLYTVADQSTSSVQRQYLAESLAAVLPGFADVEYRDWRSLLDRLARDAAAARWRGPLVLDELPYQTLAAPELPSVLQQWVDHAARDARLIVAVAGSSQRMMQGLALTPEAPLYGRAQALLEVRPLSPEHVPAAGVRDPVAAAEFYAAWGGIPRYWELATDSGPDTVRNVADLVLDPLGPLHHEPDRLLIEELPSAAELRPILDAIGGGAHRLSEIASRMGRPATSLSRALQRLIELGLIHREVPYGEPEDRSKRSLYRIADPFFRLWFRVVAPHRSRLVTASAGARLAFLRERWDHVMAESWEELCRRRLPALEAPDAVRASGGWSPGARWWHGNQPEWDIVARSPRGTILLGEAKWSRDPFALSEIRSLASALRSKPHPALPARDRGAEKVWALFVPRVRGARLEEVDGVRIVTAADLFATPTA